MRIVFDIKLLPHIIHPLDIHRSSIRLIINLVLVMSHRPSEIRAWSYLCCIRVCHADSEEGLVVELAEGPPGLLFDGTFELEAGGEEVLSDIGVSAAGRDFNLSLGEREEERYGAEESS